MRHRNHRPHGPAYLDRPLTFEQVPEHRNVDCGLYGVCLEVVVRRRWPSFTCRPCSLWHRQPRPQYGGSPAQVLVMPLAARR